MPAFHKKSAGMSGSDDPRRELPAVAGGLRLLLFLRVIWPAAVAVVAGTAGRLSPQVAALIALWVGLSLAATWLARSGRAGGWGVLSVSSIDLLAGLALIGASGVGSSPLWWTPLIAGTTAGLATGFLGGLAWAGIGALLWMSWIVAGGGASADLLAVGQRVAGLSLGAVLIGWITHQVRSRFLDRAGPRDGQAGPAAATLLRVASELNASLSGAEVPDLVLGLAMQALAEGSSQPDRSAGALLLAQGSGLRLVVGRGLPAADLDRLLPGRAGDLAAALRSGAARLCRAPGDDPELRQLAFPGAFPLVLCVPLRNPEEVVGALLLAHSQPSRFSPARIELLQALGVQATTALRNARLVRDLEQERDRITETEEEARRKLARDLHDGPTQTIAAIAMRLNYARRLIERDPTAAGEEIHKLEEIARQTTREIRHMLFTLRPLVLESKGLVPALRQLAAKAAETHGQQVIVEAEPDSDRGLDARAQAVAFFIAEEAISNARKHAESEHVWVRMRRQADQRFILEVQDDGVGFNVGAVDAHYEQRGSLGMVNMRERAELIQARLHLESAEGRGTHIVLEVPLEGLPAPEEPRPEPG
jgi:signal transduction histidine kinase